MVKVRKKNKIKRNIIIPLSIILTFIISVYTLFRNPIETLKDNSKDLAKKGGHIDPNDLFEESPSHNPHSQQDVLGREFAAKPAKRTDKIAKKAAHEVRNIQEEHNALMYAAKYQSQPKHRVKLLLAVDRSDETKDKLLSFQGKHGLNPLMHAVKHHPDKVQLLLKAVSSAHIKNKMLTAKDEQGMNALMHAVRHHPDKVQPLLAAASDDTVRYEMLTAKDIDGRNVLVYTARYRSDVAQSLIDSARSYKIKDEMLKAKDNQDLIFAALCRADKVQPLLAAVSDDTVKYKMLTDKDEVGRNVLTYAVQYQSDAVQPLLAAASAAGFKDELLTAKDSNRKNVLMYAAEYQSDAVQPILDAASSARVKDELLIDKDIFGSNALIWAAFHNADAVQPILDAASTAGVKDELLTHKDITGANALIRAAFNSADAVQPILDAASSASTGVKDEMLTAKDKHQGNNALMYARHDPKSTDLLLKSGADPKQKNNQGRNSLDEALDYFSTTKEYSNKERTKEVIEKYILKCPEIATKEAIEKARTLGGSELARVIEDAKEAAEEQERHSKSPSPKTKKGSAHRVDDYGAALHSRENRVTSR